MGNAYRDDLAFRRGLTDARRLLNTKIPERQLQGQVLDLAALKGWFSYHTFDSRRSPPGFPDLVLVRGPRMVAAELKSAGAKLTTAQQTWLNALAAVAGVETYAWWPDDWAEIERTLA